MPGPSLTPEPSGSTPAGSPSSPPPSGSPPGAGTRSGFQDPLVQPGSAGFPPGVPASMGPAALQAPWRMVYLTSMDEPKEAKPTGASAPAGSGSFLLDYWRTPEADMRNHVIVRTGAGMILLNAYPYAAGHVLVALGDAKPAILDYAPELRVEFWKLLEAACDLVQTALEPQGLNVGINQGKAAGAGVPGHLHAHVVPRWGGDTNFMTVVGQVRVMPASLEASAQTYRQAWATRVRTRHAQALDL